MIKLKEIIKEELLKEDDYATQYVDMVDDITKEVNRISVWIDKHFRKFIVDIKKITAKIED